MLWWGKIDRKYNTRKIDHGGSKSRLFLVEITFDNVRVVLYSRTESAALWVVCSFDVARLIGFLLILTVSFRVSQP